MQLNASSVPSPMDVDAVGHPNFSTVRPPPPAEMRRPPPAPETYYVVTAGEKVGIFNNAIDLETVRLPLLPYFHMTRFHSWELAHKYYSDKYSAKEIHLVPSADGRVQHPPAPLPNPQAATSIAVAPVLHVAAASTAGPALAGTAAAPALLPTASSILARVLIEPTNVDDRDTFLGILNSPFGRLDHPIVVSSAFPTPEPPARTKVSKPNSEGVLERYRKGIERAKRSPSASRSTLAKAIQLARKKPTPGRSKVKVSVLGKKSSAATRIRRNSGGKGKSKAGPRLVHGDSEDSEIDILIFDDSDSSDFDPTGAGPSHPMTLRPRIEPLVYQQDTTLDASTTQAGSASSAVPVVTITAPIPATPATNNAARHNPFHYSPFTDLLKPALATPPRVSNTTVINSPASYDELVEDAMRTPELTRAQRRFAIIHEAIQRQETPRAVNHTTPGTSSPLPQYSTPASANNATATGSSYITENTPTNNPAPLNTSTPSSPETEYGLSADLDAKFLDEAAHLLDQVYTKSDL